MVFKIALYQIRHLGISIALPKTSTYKLPKLTLQSLPIIKGSSPHLLHFYSTHIQYNIMVSVTMDRPFDDLRNRQQAIARRRKKKKFSLLLSQITVPSPHYNNDVDIRSNTKMMKYVIYSTGKDLFCYCVCVCVRV